MNKVYYEDFNLVSNSKKNSFDMQQQITQDVSHETEDHNIIQVNMENPYVIGIFLFGAVSLSIVAFRVFRNNPWVKETLKMWGVKKK